MRLEDLTRRAAGLAQRESGRVIIGICGLPGAGKTTLAERITARFGQPQRSPESSLAAHVPLDGFHLADSELIRLGKLEAKGAPETFDPAGYTALLRRLHDETDHIVYAPSFDRELEQPIAGAIPVFPAAKIIFTEGNYLLSAGSEWHQIRAMCTEIWFCEQHQQTRVNRLIERHIRFGKSPEAAAAWVREVDEPNARLIESTRSHADLIFRIDEL